VEISCIPLAGDSRLAAQTEHVGRVSPFGSTHEINPRNQQQRDEDYTGQNTAPNDSVDHGFGFQI
jgi:hypothetical protein